LAAHDAIENADFEALTQAALEATEQRFPASYIAQTTMLHFSKASLGGPANPRQC
jgi:hypothetical protein